MTEESSIINKKGRMRLGGFFKRHPWVVILIVVLITVGVLGSVLIAGATSGGKYVTAETPEEAVEQSVKKHYQGRGGDSYIHVHTRTYVDSAVVLFELPQGSNPANLYYWYVWHDYTGWYTRSDRGDDSYSTLRTRDELGEYIRYGWRPGPERAVVWGRTVSDEVAAVEVDVHNSGQTIRADVQDGLFVVVSGIWGSEDAIRALDADGNVLAEYVAPHMRE